MYLEVSQLCHWIWILTHTSHILNVFADGEAKGGKEGKKSRKKKKKWGKEKTSTVLDNLQAVYLQM